MATVVATADPTTGTIRVDVEQTVLRDLFTRVTASGWGNATTGATWTTTGGAAADYSTTGTRGQISLTSTNVNRRTQIGAGWADTDQSITLIPGVVALTQAIEMSLMSRRDSGANTQYQATVLFDPGNALRIRITAVVAGVSTNIQTVSLPFTYVAASQVRLRMVTCGNQIMAKAWLSTTAEPTAWNVSVVDLSIPQSITPNQVGARAFLVSGNTNTLPVNVQFDDYVVSYGQPLHLYRVTPDGVQTEVRGSPFFTEPATAASASATAVMFDNEAPFDVNVFYRLYTDCGTLAEISNTVVLDSDGDGWLRNPTNPSANIRIAMEGWYDDCLDQDLVVFAGLGARTYANSAGIFDVVDDRRPITVSQVRKNLGSTLFLTSFSLDDVDAVEDVLDPNTVLVLSLPVVYGFGHRTYGTDYITVYDVDSDFVGIDQRVTTRSWVLPFRTSYAPADTSEGGTGGNGIGGGGATYDDLAASVLGTTYNSLTASAETYLQVAQGVGY